MLGRDVYEYVRQIDYDQVGAQSRAGQGWVGHNINWQRRQTALLGEHWLVQQLPCSFLLKSTLLLNSAFTALACTPLLQYFDSRAAARDGRLMKQCVPDGNMRQLAYAW